MPYVYLFQLGRSVYGFKEYLQTKTENKEKLSQSAVRKMTKKYASACHEKCADVPLDLHAHQFRHAKASHWLEDAQQRANLRSGGR